MEDLGFSTFGCVRVSGQSTYGISSSVAEGSNRGCFSLILSNSDFW